MSILISQASTIDGHRLSPLLPHDLLKTSKKCIEGLHNISAFYVDWKKAVCAHLMLVGHTPNYRFKVVTNAGFIARSLTEIQFKTEYTE